jgi:hypothetical protein
MLIRSHFAWLVLAVAVAATGCASAPDQPKAWRDPGYTGRPFAKLFVIGLSSKNLADRRNFEDLLVAQINAVGGQAVPGYQFIPPGIQPDRAMVAAAVGRSGADGVLLARITGYQTRDAVGMAVDPGFNVGFDAYADTFVAPVDVQYQVATVYTTLFAVGATNPVWSYDPKTFDPATLQQQAGAYAREVVGMLQSSGLLSTRLGP